MSNLEVLISPSYQLMNIGTDTKKNLIFIDCIPLAKQGDDRFGSICRSVCLFVRALLFELLDRHDLDFGHI